MLVAFRIPVIALRCSKCGARAPTNGSSYGGKVEVELPCKCPISEPELAFYYPEDHRNPVAVLRLEVSADRRIREGNDAAGVGS